MSDEAMPEAIDISADRPGTDPSQDALGYAPFAQRLAKGILQLPSDEGLVIAIYGKWGLGKTTFLNYVHHYLKQSPREFQPVYVPFNPWWFSGDESLLLAFFNDLRAHLGGTSDAVAELGEKLASLADAVSTVPSPHTAMAKPFAYILRKTTSKPKDVESLKKDIAATLRKSPRRVLVTIDDIDRLTPEEIRQVFRVIKSVADFPNVTYLLAFDKNIVSASISTIQGGSGEDYLEKVVQIPFELPLADRLSIRRLLVEKLTTILSGLDAKEFDKTYWNNVFYESIDKFIETPRDVVRFSNALAVTFRAIMGEVNPVDFVAMESLRIFCPEVYNVIRNNGQMFTGSTPSDLVHPTRAELDRFHTRWLEEYEKSASPSGRKAVVDMLKRLFPKLQSVWSNVQYGFEHESSWRRNRRICSADIFPVYFSLSVGSGALSNSEIRSMLSKVGDQAAFSEGLLKLAKQLRTDGRTRLSEFLERLQDYTEDQILIEHIEPIVLSLFDIGDTLIIPEDEPRGLGGHGNDVRMGRAQWQLLGRLDRAHRFGILQNAFERGRAVHLMWRIVSNVREQQGRYDNRHQEPEEGWLVSATELEVLEGKLLDRVREAANDGSLMTAPHLPSLLYFWSEKGGMADANDWSEKATISDDGLLLFLEGFLGTVTSIGAGEVVSVAHYTLDTHHLKPYIDPDKIVGRVRELAGKKELTPRQRRTLDAFLRGYDLRKRGLDPNSPRWLRMFAE